MKTINEIIKNAYLQFGEKEYLFEKVDGQYQSISYKQFIEDSNSIASYFLSNGYQGKKIMIYAPNSILYLKIQLAIMAYVGICVNVSAKTSLEDLIELATDINCDTVLYDGPEKIEKKGKIHFISFKELVSKVDFKNQLLENINRDYEECIQILFSSGTTSKPKGVMLSTKNLFWSWEPLQKRTPLNEDDIIYLFLPLHHIYANLYNFLYSLLSGLKIYFCSDISKLQQEVLEVEPTIFCGVPLIYERYLKSASDKLKYAFGSRIRFLYSGGAPLSEELRKTYRQNGLTLLNAYSLTETSGGLSIDYPNDDNFTSVGTIFENVDVKIIDKNEEGIGEIVVKGGNLFLGYACGEVCDFTEDGYLKTRDLGYIKDKHLYVTDRKDNIVVCPNGENININRVEAKLKKLSSKIKKVTATIQDNKIQYIIYVQNKYGIHSIIKKYNETSEKIYQILYYQLLNTKEMNFKEQID